MYVCQPHGAAGKHSLNKKARLSRYSQEAVSTLAPRYVFSGPESTIEVRSEIDLASLFDWAKTECVARSHTQTADRAFSHKPSLCHHRSPHLSQDACWNPNSGHLLCSVGGDKMLYLWDSRVGSAPVAKLQTGHTAVVNW